MKPSERIRRFFARIEATNSDLRVFLDLRQSEALHEAQQSDERHKSGQLRSPIDGKAVAIKANIPVFGLPCHAGIDAYRNEKADAHGEVVKRLENAGAIVLGTVNMHEGALGATTDNEAFGRTQNPWLRGATPGGSSGGSAAAVAARLCDFALGSDTMGSIRIPSAYCGVQGIKPTFGAVPAEDILALSPSLDHIGPHAANVANLRAALLVLAPNLQSFEAASRFGLWYPGAEVHFDEAVQEGFEDALAKAETALQASFSAVVPPAYNYGASRRAGLILSEVEGAKIHDEQLRKNPAGFSDGFRKLLQYGQQVPSDRVQAARAHIEDIRSAADSLFSAVDIVLAPTVPQTAFSFDGDVPSNQADMTAWANFAGLPAAAICTGLSSKGLPLSMQIIGRRGADLQVLAIAERLEEAFGQPPTPPGFS